MKTKLMTGLRSAAAASGVALLLLVSACGSDEGQGEQGSASEESAAETTDDAAEETTDDTAAETTEDDAADEPAEGAEETTDDDAAEDEDGAAAGVAAPGDGFDPCTVLTADDVNGILGSDLAEGTSSDMSSIAMCTFMDQSSGSSVIVQWAPVPGSLDDALQAMSSMYADLGEPEPVTVAGTSEAAVITGEVSGFPATILVGTAEGGFLQVVATAQDMSSDQAVQIAETTLAGV